MVSIESLKYSQKKKEVITTRPKFSTIWFYSNLLSSYQLYSTVLYSILLYTTLFYSILLYTTLLSSYLLDLTHLCFIILISDLS